MASQRWIGFALAGAAGALVASAALLATRNREAARAGASTRGAEQPPVLGFKGKVVLITGSGGGIGGALAQRFAREGCRLALHYNTSKASCEALREECLRLGAVDAETFQADLGDETGEGAKKLFSAVLARFGGECHIVVNNAGKYEEQPSVVSEAHYGEFIRTLNNAYKNCLLGAAALTFLFGAHCAERKKTSGSSSSDEAVGAVVNIGSRGAFRGEPTAWAYGGLKSAQHAVAQSAAVTLAQHGVVVATVAPGFVATAKKDPVLDGPRGAAIKAQSPWNRVAKQEEVAETALHLAKYWLCPWVTGTIVDVNGASYLRA